MQQPVFFDASGRRDLWSKRALASILFLLFAAAIGLALTIALVPVDRAIYPVGERSQARPLREKIAHVRPDIGRWLPVGEQRSGLPVSVGFYVPWDPDSRLSLQRNIGQLDWIVPALASVTDGGATRTYLPDAAFTRVIDRSANHPHVLPMIQNARADRWDGNGMAAILADPGRRAALLDWSEQIIMRERGSGIVFDFEELPASALSSYRIFLKEARGRLAAKKWLVTLAVPIDDTDWDLPAFASVADRLFLMNYDEHSPGNAPGPIASQAWFVANLDRALARLPQGKAIVAIGGYAYDWAGGHGDNMTVEEAWLAANDSGTRIAFDQASGNATFSYADDDGTAHVVWMLDAASGWNQLRAARAKGVSGYALWRLGAEDSGYWTALAALRRGGVPDLRAIRSVGNVDVEGTGELLRIEATPRVGRRTMRFDRTGLIRDVRFDSLPTPYVVRRGGNRPGMVALTFDDGPDPVWTPKILDILESRHARATFFVIGENALMSPGLLDRILAGGSEIGNHSYTHPNLAEVSDTGIKLELNATQRVVEAYTGRSLRLFRAPYFGDAEPTTSDELQPALVAQQRGYLNVGLHVDPNDWQRPGVQAIVDQTLAGVARSTADQPTRIVLLHDGGGNRAQTVAALPAIIDGLRARGLTLVPVSELAGLPHDVVMPKVAGWQLVQVRADIGVFLFAAGLLWLVKWLFFVAITLGIGRAVLMTGLALRARRNEWHGPAPAVDPSRFVSVLIPAFNEERVIVGSVKRVLLSEDVQLEVIVIDDGSSDATSEVVRKAFENDPRVYLLTLENGGKAGALNGALAIATGDIVIALDADTQFEKLTVARLARWFADPRIGAVAGNAKVGNRVNILTRWQAIEYVTAQNLERRALTQFDAITVVPGAVGAWRRAALDAVGGYPVDTLAEDQDLTIAVQRAGWRVGYDTEAIAWTEAPERFAPLVRQRFRWAYGTLQCLWKHAAILRDRRPRGLALVGIPQAWLFQVIFAMISPIIDLALLVSIIGTIARVQQHGWAQTQSDVLTMGLYWLVFVSIDVLCGWVAFRLDDRERRYPAVLLVAQRFVYRQLMYWVVIRALGAALRGPRVSWGKLERTGRVAVQA